VTPRSLARLWPLALVAISGVTSWLAVDQWRDRLVAQGRAEFHQARAKSLRAVVEAQDAARARADSQAVHAAAEARQARSRADSVAEVSARRRPEIVERIVHAPDTTAIRVAVAELEAEHAGEVSALRRAMASQDSVIRSQAGQIAERDRALAVRDELIASLEAAAGDTKGRGFLETWGERVVAAAVGYSLGKGIEAVVRQGASRPASQSSVTP
jgi:hypothetical protein